MKPTAESATPESTPNSLTFPDYAARIAHLKSFSGYHFDPFRVEPPPFQILGRFGGADWMPEVLALTNAGDGVSEFGFSNCCNNSRARNLKNYQFDLELTGDQNYGMDHVFVDRVKTPLMTRERLPNIFKMIDWFEFTPESVEARIHVQSPGQVFPVHVDGLDAQKTDPATRKEMRRNPRKWCRVQVMLEDWVWGHVWAMGNSYWSQWHAGDIMYFKWWETPHATANCGFAKRYSLQITGVATDATLRKLALRGKPIPLNDLT